MKESQTMPTSSSSSRSSSRKEKANAINDLPTYLGLAYEELQLGSRLKSGPSSTPIEIFQERIDSNIEESAELSQSIFLVKTYILEHLESQFRRTSEASKMYTKAASDYKRLEEGVGTAKELAAFKILFSEQTK